MRKPKRFLRYRFDVYGQAYIKRWDGYRVDEKKARWRKVGSALSDKPIVVNYLDEVGIYPTFKDD